MYKPDTTKWKRTKAINIYIFWNFIWYRVICKWNFMAHLRTQSYVNDFKLFRKMLQPFCDCDYLSSYGKWHPVETQTHRKHMWWVGVKIKCHKNWRVLNLKVLCMYFLSAIGHSFCIFRADFTLWKHLITDSRLSMADTMWNALSILYHTS